VNTLALTKPEKAQLVENHLIQQARSGQLMNKFGEDQLISLLERLSEQTQKKTVVNVRKKVSFTLKLKKYFNTTFFKYERRRNAIDSDSD